MTTILKQQHGTTPPKTQPLSQPDRSTGAGDATPPPTTQCPRTLVQHARTRPNTTACAATTGTWIRFFTKSYLPVETFSTFAKCSAGESKAFAPTISRLANWQKNSKPACMRTQEESFRHLHDFTAPQSPNNCHTGPSTEMCAPRARFHQCSYLQGKALRDGI